MNTSNSPMGKVCKCGHPKENHRTGTIYGNGCQKCDCNSFDEVFSPAEEKDEKEKLFDMRQNAILRNREFMNHEKPFFISKEIEERKSKCCGAEISIGINGRNERRIYCKKCENIAEIEQGTSAGEEVTIYSPIYKPPAEPAGWAKGLFTAVDDYEKSPSGENYEKIKTLFAEAIEKAREEEKNIALETKIKWMDAFDDERKSIIQSERSRIRAAIEKMGYDDSGKGDWIVNRKEILDLLNEPEA